ncbi:hypothetical protein SRHO_G00005440, partial [Serrasalmus rhombeus]
MRGEHEETHSGNACMVGVKYYRMDSHPSIHPFSKPLLHQGRGGMLEPIPTVIGRKAGYTLDRSPVHRRADRQTQTVTHTQGQFSMSNWPDCMSLDCGRKPENPEETHADTGRTCKLHTERTLATRPGNRTQALLAVRQQRYPPRHHAAQRMNSKIVYYLKPRPFIVEQEVRRHACPSWPHVCGSLK